MAMISISSSLELPFSPRVQVQSNNAETAVGPGRIDEHVNLEYRRMLSSSKTVAMIDESRSPIRRLQAKNSHVSGSILDHRHNLRMIRMH